MSALLDCLLTDEQRADVARADAAQASELRRIIRGEPYLWSHLVPWRTETPHRRRDEPTRAAGGDDA